MHLPFRRACVVLALAATCAHARPAGADRAPGVARMRLIGRGHHVWLRARVNGRRGTFVLDTGAAVTVLDARFARRCHVTPDGAARFAGIGASRGGGARSGRLLAPLARVDRMALGALTLRGVEVAVLDLDPLTGALGGSADGLLGWNALCGHRVTIDPLHRELVLDDPDTGATPPGGELLALGRVAGVPVVTARAGGVAGPFVLDSGNGFALELDPAFARRAGAQPAHRVVAAGVGGSFAAAMVAVDGFELAGHTLPRTGAATWDPPAASLSGMIGWPVMSQFVWTLEPVRGRAWLVPIAPAGRGRQVRTGLQDPSGD
jgi:aspartyl protease